MTLIRVLNKSRSRTDPCEMPENTSFYRLKSLLKCWVLWFSRNPVSSFDGKGYLNLLI